jgi:small nuclear ribonucleoprotein (snRNP)-like protein
MKVKSLALASILVLTPLAQTARAHPQTNPDQSAKIKSEVAKRIANKKNHVNIELRNGDKLKGRLEQADEIKFTIRQDNTGNKLEVSYSDVLKVKGQGLGTGAKIGIAVGLAAAVVAVVVVIALRNFDPFEGGIRVP